jgi:hypothetical protein
MNEPYDTRDYHQVPTGTVPAYVPPESGSMPQSRIPPCANAVRRARIPGLVRRQPAARLRTVLVRLGGAAALRKGTMSDRANG